jgi:hypothetical protein
MTGSSARERQTVNQTPAPNTNQNRTVFMDAPLIGAHRKRVNPFGRRLFAIETGGISSHFEGDM